MFRFVHLFFLYRGCLVGFLRNTLVAAAALTSDQSVKIETTNQPIIMCCLLKGIRLPVFEGPASGVGASEPGCEKSYDTAQFARFTTAYFERRLKAFVLSQNGAHGDTGVSSISGVTSFFRSFVRPHDCSSILEMTQYAEHDGINR